MKTFRDEADFQRWAISNMIVRGAHVQDHSYLSPPSVPDLSVGLSGQEYWLELKFNRFNVNREHAHFEFTETKRGQLEWLVRRERAICQPCGILGLMQILPSLTQYMVYIPAWMYLDRVWMNKGLTASAVMLSKLSVMLQKGVHTDVLSHVREADAVARDNAGRLLR